jgi:hypothetical protein
MLPRRDEHGAQLVHGVPFQVGDQVDRRHRTSDLTPGAAVYTMRAASDISRTGNDTPLRALMYQKVARLLRTRRAIGE